MILTRKEYYKGTLIDSIINPYTNLKIAGGDIRLLQSIKNGPLEYVEIDYDVEKYHKLTKEHGQIRYLGMSNHDTYHSDVIILRKLLEFQGKKFVFVKNREISCIFTDMNYLLKTLFELDLEYYSDSSPVDTILDADTGQAVYLFYTDPCAVYTNF